jgi:imidazolonepropionase
MSGERYTAGGINYTVEKTRSSSDQALRTNAASLISEMHSTGTTSFEIKSAMGLLCKMKLDH